MLKQGFWLLLSAAAIIWYSTITIYIAWKGITDIKKMLARLNTPRRPQKLAGGKAADGFR